MTTPIKKLKNLLEIAEAELLPEGSVLHGLLVPVELVREIISAQSEIIYCKDCRKHNVRVGHEVSFKTNWRDDACPLADWRGKAQGHEFDYQYCVYAERRTDGETT